MVFEDSNTARKLSNNNHGEIQRIINLQAKNEHRERETKIQTCTCRRMAHRKQSKFMETYRFMVKEDELETRSKDREEEDQYTHRQRIRENTERGEQRNRDYRNNKKGLY